MLNTILAQFYQRDLEKLISELNSFQDEKNIWRVTGSIKNSSGNLALHLIGGLNFLIGTHLANTGYIRDRDAEFTSKAVDRTFLTAQIQELSELIKKTLDALSAEQMESDYPIPFDGQTRPVSYLLVQLLAHLNYHLGQVNYLRRSLE
jgi:hypothetical protein